MKHSMIASTLLLCLSITHSAVAEVSCSDLQNKGLACFRSGDVARADDINHNFDNLIKAIDQLQAAIEGLKKSQQGTTQRLKRIDSLANETKSLKSGVDSLNRSQQGTTQRLKRIDSLANETKSLRAGVDGLKKSQQSTTQRLNRVSIGNCKKIKGKCGAGMYNKPTYYLDRVRFSCPSQQPLLRSLRFLRCGKIKTKDEGLLVEATCCALTK